jgi:hypothetical protein
LRLRGAALNEKRTIVGDSAYLLLLIRMIAVNSRYNFSSSRY